MEKMRNLHNLLDSSQTFIVVVWKRRKKICRWFTVGPCFVIYNYQKNIGSDNRSGTIPAD